MYGLIYYKQMKLVVIFLVLSLALALAATHQPARQLVITTRTATVTKMCASFQSRDSLVDAQTKAIGEANKASMKASFKKQGNELINSLLKNPDGILSAAVAQLPNISTDLGLFVGPFALGLIISILIWPFLCCCCCCPNCCPSKCCQKADNEQYTKCELIWPAVVVILALLLVIVASVIGVTRASDIEQSYKSVTCAAAITFDDVINGNASTTGKFFSGLNGLKNSITDLSGNINAVKTKMDGLKISNTTRPLSQAHASGVTLLSDVSKIPKGTAGDQMLAFTYPHFDGLGTSGTLSSTFPDALGGTTANTGAISIAHAVLKGINDGLELISNTSNSFSSQFGSISTNLADVQNSMQGIVDMANGFDNQVSGYDDIISPIMKIVTLGVTVVFGVFIAFGVLGIVGALMMTFCDKFSCRYLVYAMCFILTILGIICFLLSLLFSILTPVIYFGCDFLTVSISSATSFRTNVGNVMGDFSNYLSVCLPGESGDIINQLSGVDVSSINQISSVITDMRAFDTTMLQTTAQTSLDSLESFINKFYYTDEYDFTDPDEISFVSSIANPSAYASCSAINSFSADKWVPSLRNSQFTCSGTTSTASTAECPATSDVNTGRGASVAASGCFGCMDTSKILMTVSPAPNFSTRYADAGCVAWINKINTFKTNYLDNKVTEYAGVKTRMTAAKSSYTSDYSTKLTAVGSDFASIISNLQSTVNSVFDPQYGMMAGLNCLILGQDINLIAGTACSRLFNTLYLLRLALGLCAFGILFFMCCGTCSGVRSFKHMNRSTSVLPDPRDIPNQSTMHGLNQKY